MEKEVQIALLLWDGYRLRKVWMHFRFGLPQELFDGPERLPRPVIVLNQGEADEAFSERTEAHAGRHGYKCFLQQKLRKLQRTQ